MNTIAYRLRHLRESKGLSQRKVAEYIGITRAAYNKYERGTSRPVRKLQELSQLFGVSMDYIMGKDETPLEKKMGLHAEHISYEQIDKYFQLSDNGRKMVDIMLNAVYAMEQDAIEKQGCRAVQQKNLIVC